MISTFVPYRPTTSLCIGGILDAKEAGKIMQAYRKRKQLTQDQVVERSTVPTPQYLSALENGRYDVRNSDHFKSLVEVYGLSAEDIRDINPSAVIEIQPAGPLKFTMYRINPSFESNDAVYDVNTIASNEGIPGGIEILEIKKVDDKKTDISAEVGGVSLEITSIYDPDQFFDRSFFEDKDNEHSSFDPRTLFYPQAQRRREKRPLWPNLAQMIEEKQEKHPTLRETRWQQHLNQTRFSGGQEPDAEGWFEMYQTLRRNNVEPEAWPDED